LRTVSESVTIRIASGLISKAPKATLSEIKVQIAQIKALLAELEKNIQGQLQRGRKSPKAPKAGTST
jgi:hypothetical protein